MIQFLNTPEDCQWLRETHLQGMSHTHDFKSFVLEGNEDAPTLLKLYTSEDPLYTDGYVEVDPTEGMPRVTCHPSTA